ncbi:MAG: hypothetical protein HC842_00415, partial [Cytophagales bacterium]|nr:hypothetical protein [Cytophagales bacterium]
MKKNQLKLWALALWAALAACQKVEAPKEEWNIVSPSSQLVFTVFQKDSSIQGESQKMLYYKVQDLRKDRLTEIIEPSQLGLAREDARFVENLKFISWEPVKEVRDEFNTASGKTKTVKRLGKELVLHFENPDRLLIDLVCRIYDDGVAFRYRFPASDSSRYTITQELTAFNLPTGGLA